MKIGVDRLVGMIFVIILTCSSAWAADVTPRQPVADYVNGALKVTQVSVGTGSGSLLTPQAARRRICIQNIRSTNTGSIYIESTGAAATTNDWEIPLGGIFWLDLGPNVTVYAISASGTQDIRVLEVN